MKKYLTGAIIGILVASLGGHFYSRWRTAELRQQNESLRTEIVIMTEGLEQHERMSNQKIDALLVSIGELQGNIDSLMFVNANLETELGAAAAHTSEAEARAAALTAEIQPVLDANPTVREAFAAKDEAIASLKVENFTLKQQRANDQKIIFSLTEKYEAQVRISTEYLGQVTAAKGLLAKVELRLNLQDKRVVRLERLSNWKTGGIVVAGAVALALMIF